ncbi:MAG TPA: hypothetical protein PKG96_08940 [Bacilli bacterium]|jgi:hypothetical protein|nr:hypothetical protein [Bacilli bacterium]
MTQREYIKLSGDLQQLARIIPIQWGNIQNDGTDKQIDMFQIHSFEELERQINTLSENSKTISDADGFYGNARNVMNVFFV